MSNEDMNAPFVLFIDDSRPTHDRVANAFSASNVKLECTKSWVEVKRSVFSERPPDLLLLDLNMPALDGVPIGRALKRRRDIKIIIYSSEPEERLREATAQIDANGYVSKSDSDDDLVSIVMSTLEGTNASKKAL